MNGLLATSGWIWCASKLANLSRADPADDDDEAAFAVTGSRTNVPYRSRIRRNVER